MMGPSLGPVNLFGEGSQEAKGEQARMVRTVASTPPALTPLARRLPPCRPPRLSRRGGSRGRAGLASRPLPTTRAEVAAYNDEVTIARQKTARSVDSLSHAQRLTGIVVSAAPFSRPGVASALGRSAAPLPGLRGGG